jgi:hypothetical protein
MKELSKSPSEKISRWKERAMFLSQTIETFNFTSTSSQETDYRTDTPADKTKDFYNFIHARANRRNYKWHY